MQKTKVLDLKFSCLSAFAFSLKISKFLLPNRVEQCNDNAF